jgi:hypothetical protein
MDTSVRVPGFGPLSVRMVAHDPSVQYPALDHHDFVCLPAPNRDAFPPLFPVLHYGVRYFFLLMQQH